VAKYDTLKMRIAVVIPNRPGRERFYKHCLYLLSNQTVKPDFIIDVNDESPSTFTYTDAYGNQKTIPNKCDITWRYRLGYERASALSVDCVLLMENDDWYAPNYIETMVNKWIELGKPDLLGHDYTIYYHIGVFGYVTMNHKLRSSAMNTLIKPGLTFKWPLDHDPYTDLWLWQKSRLQGKIFTPSKTICLGIKHGDGLTGGRRHIDRIDKYERDAGKMWLKNILGSDEKSYYFYCGYLNSSNK
jgi:hypothetical protein